MQDGAGAEVSEQTTHEKAEIARSLLALSEDEFVKVLDERDAELKAALAELGRLRGMKQKNKELRRQVKDLAERSRRLTAAHDALVNLPTTAREERLRAQMQHESDRAFEKMKENSRLQKTIDELRAEIESLRYQSDVSDEGSTDSMSQP